MFIFCPWCQGPLPVPPVEHEDVGVCMLCGKPIRYMMLPDDHFDKVASLEELTVEQVVTVRTIQTRLAGFRALQPRLH